MATLAPAYAPRRPTETALYGIVRDNVETFLSWARETYAKPLPRYVEQELRAYLRCGVFAHGFVHCRCDDCGHDILVAFSCKQRGACPSCAGRRMANTAAHLVAGDDLGRERLCRYGARPPLSLERLRRLSGGRVAYRVKYVSRGRAKHRVMTSIELLARLSALLPPPRFPLTRYHGVLAPRSSWRREIAPRAPARSDEVIAVAVANRRCSPGVGKRDQPVGKGTPARPRTAGGGRAVHESRHRPAPSNGSPLGGAPHFNGSAAAAATAPSLALAPERDGLPDVELLAPNTLGVRHWSRLLGGLLYATSPRLSWPLLLRRTFDIDILDCAKCHGRLRVIAAIVDVRDACRILERLGVLSAAPQAARARDPTHLDDEEHASA